MVRPSSQGVGPLRRREERLGRHAACPRAVATEPLSLDQSNTLAKASCELGSRQARGATTNDEQIERRWPSERTAGKEVGEGHHDGFSDSEAVGVNIPGGRIFFSITRL